MFDKKENWIKIVTHVAIWSLNKLIMNKLVDYELWLRSNSILKNTRWNPFCGCFFSFVTAIFGEFNQKRLDYYLNKCTVYLPTPPKTVDVESNLAFFVAKSWLLLSDAGAITAAWLSNSSLPRCNERNWNNTIINLLPTYLNEESRDLKFILLSIDSLHYKC